MSQSESFIEEVTEEVRRDRLFAFIRRWFWLAALLVVLIVALAAWNEWRKAQQVRQAQAFGDAVVAALAAEDPLARAEALSRLEAEGGAEAFLNLLIAAETGGGDEAAVAAASLAEPLAEDTAARWRQLTELKLVLAEAGALSAEERIARLAPLTAAGAPYRLLALEQTALAHVAAGETEAALAILQDLTGDQDASGDLRRRAAQMIVALGGEPVAQ